MISYEYFMDDLRDWELDLLMTNIDYSHKHEWEMTRLQMYSSMIPYMKRGSSKTPKDILPLPTDDDYDDHEIEITNQQIEHLKTAGKMLGNKLKQKQS